MTRVLITNDDGIHSRGLETLERVARDIFDDVFVAAPATEKSAVGQSITLHDPIRCRKLSSQRWAIAGTPVDCVLIALGHLMTDGGPPDLVLSGINRGPNISYDVFYSGTVAGAREGQIKGIPGVALSLAALGRYDFDAIAPAVDATLRRIAGLRLDPGILLNVNFPAPDRAAQAHPEAHWGGVTGYRGMRLTSLGHRSYRDEIIVRDDPRGRPYVWIGGEFPELVADPGTDCEAILDGYISVTPLQLDTTDAQTAERLARSFD